MRKESNKNIDKLIHLSRFLFGDTSVTFTNENPTQTEKTMFEHYGLYLVEKTEDKYTYAPVHLKDGYTYQTSVNADDETIEWNHTIEFDTSLDLVKINHFCDLMLVELVRSRMKELNMH